MRRFATLAAATVILAGCQTIVGSPVAGFGGFVSDTHTFKSNPNRPVGSAENLRRVMGQDVAIEPLPSESGNIWPGPSKPEPTLEDILSQEQPAAGGTVTPSAGGGATPDRLRLRSLTQPAADQPATGQPVVGPPPGGGSSIVVPNGNGTSTVINPDGSTKTIPSTN